MSWSVTYILSQVLTVVEYGLLGLSYLAKRRVAVVILDIVSMLTGIVVFILLGADLGMAMSVVIFVANFYYLWDEKKQEGRKKKVYYTRDYVVLAVVLLAILVLTILTYDGPLSLLSVAATTLYEISIWQKSTMVYKFIGIPVSLCWMSYNGFVGSIFGVLCETVMLTTSIVGYVIEVKKRKAERLKAGRRKEAKRLAAGKRTEAKRLAAGKK